jgi:hypothetical protein
VVPAPATQTIRASQPTAVATPPAITQQVTVAPSRRQLITPLAREPVQFGFDFTADSGLNTQISVLPRHLDAIRFRFLNVPVDLLHEPTLSVGVSLDPATFGTRTAQISGTLLNLHFQKHGQDFIELALGQAGYAFDSNGRNIISIGALAEIHSPNPNFSVFLSGGGTITVGRDGQTTTEWSPITFGFIVHIANP